MNRILITGSCGFVGHHVVEWYLTKTDWEIVGLDSFRHAGDSLRNLLHNRYIVFCHDLNAPMSKRLLEYLGDIDYILNLASISDVDLSIADPLHVWENNTRIIGNILEVAREKRVKAFIQCSTDEVFGPAPEGYFHKEWETLLPSNPYSASKAAQEALCLSYWRTFGVPVILTNTMNMIGERQEPTKFLPRIIRSVLTGEQLLIHGSPERIGSRMYLDAKNLADAWLFLLQNHVPAVYHDSVDVQRPSRFNIVGQEEIDNLALAQRVAALVGKPLNYSLVDFHLTRPGHDRRYALDGSRIRELGWDHPFKLDETLLRIVTWTQAHPEWLG